MSGLAIPSIPNPARKICAQYFADCDNDGSQDSNECGLANTANVINVIVHNLTIARHNIVTLADQDADTKLASATALLGNRV